MTQKYFELFKKFSKIFSKVKIKVSCVSWVAIFFEWVLRIFTYEFNMWGFIDYDDDIDDDDDCNDDDDDDDDDNGVDDDNGKYSEHLNDLN